MSKCRKKNPPVSTAPSPAAPVTPVAAVAAAPAAWWNHPAFISLLLALVTFGVYWPVFQCGFVAYDDTVYVTENWHVLRGLSWGQVDWAFSTQAQGFWHPLTWLSHMLDVQWYGLHAWGHHLTSLLLHTASTVLLFLVLRRMTGAVWRSALVAALFALHPLHVEAVAFVAERKEVLSACFGLLTLWAYVRYVEECKGQGAGGRVWYGAALFLFLCALMSKPMVVTLPVVMLVLDYWPLGRGARSMGRGAEGGGQVSGMRLILEKIPFLVLSVGAGLLTIHTERKLGAISAVVHTPLPMRVANAVTSCLHYLEQTFWPENFAFFYPYPNGIPIAELAAGTALLVGVSLLAVGGWRRRPYLTVGWLWFLVMFSVVSGVAFQVGGYARADRFMYQPLTGVFIMVVWGLGELLGRWRVPKFVAVAGAAVILIACSWQTEKQLRNWRSPETLFRHALTVTQNNFVAENNLGYYLMSARGDLAGALECFQAATRIGPHDAGVWNNIGLALAAKGQGQDAVNAYEKALQLKPDNADAHSNLANLLSDAGQMDAAIEHYKAALAIRPDFADAHNNFGIVLAQEGKLDEALNHFRAAIYYQPGNASAHNSLGNIYILRQQFADALPEFQAAVRINPAYAEAHNGLGFALAGLGRMDEAVAQYRQCLKLDSNYAMAHYNLGCALLKLNRPDEAVAEFKETLRLDPSHAEAKQKLQELEAAKPATAP